MKPFEKFSSRCAPLPVDNIDTDQITPARFLKTTSKLGLGKALFHDWRYDRDGNPKPDFVLNRPEFAGAGILLAGNNFGCGSSREHAPWALADFGFRAIISTSFADIFRNNSLKNGLLPILVDRETHEELFRMTERDPSCEVIVDLKSQTLTLPDGKKVGFPIDAFSKKCMLEGMDDIGYLVKLIDKIDAFEAQRKD